MHPVPTICLTSPFHEIKMQQYHEYLNYTIYEDHVFGHSMPNNTLLNISYDYVSIDFKKYIQYVKIITDKGTAPVLSSLVLTKSWGLDARKMAKCFTLHVPFQKGMMINSVMIGISNSIFPHKIRPTNGWSDRFGLHVYFHKQEQFIRSFASRRHIWPDRTTNKGFRIITYIYDIEILQRRSKPQAPCIDGYDYDSWLMDNLTRTIGCRPPYWP